MSYILSILEKIEEESSSMQEPWIMTPNSAEHYMNFNKRMLALKRNSNMSPKYEIDPEIEDMIRSGKPDSEINAAIRKRNDDRDAAKSSLERDLASIKMQNHPLRNIELPQLSPTDAMHLMGGTDRVMKIQRDMGKPNIQSPYEAK